MNRSLLNEADGTVGNRVPAGWVAHDGLFWKSLDLAVGNDWIALQVKGNIVEQAIVGCLFPHTSVQTRWLKESYDILIADRWELVSNNGGVWVLVKGNRMVSGISTVGNGVISASLVFMSVSTASGTGGPAWIAVSDTKFGMCSIRGIAYGSNKFVAVGDDGKMATSTNGTAWTAVNASRIFGTNDIMAIAYGNNRFVAGDIRGKMATSADGITWMAVTDSKFGSDYIGAIVFGNGRFVAGGENGKMATSTDGTTWTAVTDSKMTVGIRAIAYGSGRFVAVADVGQMATSTNGTTWTAVTDNKANGQHFCGITYGNNMFVAIADKILTSTNGTTWTAVTSSAFIYSVSFVAYGNNKFVAYGVDNDGKTATSTNGTTWTTVPNSRFGSNYDSNIITMAYGNNKFVAAGGREMAYLPD